MTAKTTRPPATTAQKSAPATTAKTTRPHNDSKGTTTAKMKYSYLLRPPYYALRCFGISGSGR